MLCLFWSFYQPVRLLLRYGRPLVNALFVLSFMSMSYPPYHQSPAVCLSSPPTALANDTVLVRLIHAVIRTQFEYKIKSKLLFINRPLCLPLVFNRHEVKTGDILSGFPEFFFQLISRCEVRFNNQDIRPVYVKTLNPAYFPIT